MLNPGEQQQQQQQIYVLFNCESSRWILVNTDNNSFNNISIFMF